MPGCECRRSWTTAAWPNGNSRPARHRKCGKRKTNCCGWSGDMNMSSNSDILNADALLAQAKAETGTGDFGDDTLPERFRQAVEWLRSQNMDQAGQQAAAAV